MSKISLPDIGSLANSASARTAINDNFTSIEEAIDNTLSRDGSTPNQMEADIDLNSNKLLNVGDPVNDTDGVNLRSVQTIVDEYIPELAASIIEGTGRVERFTATAGQTDFPLDESPGTVENMYVFDEGVALVPGVDFHLTGDNLDTLTFFSGRTLGADIVVRYVQLAPADSQLRSDLSNPLSTMGAALVAYKAGETGGVELDLRERAAETVSDAEFGAVGDGTADDTSPLLNACNAAVARGRVLVLDGTKTYGISLQLAIPAGTKLKTNGASFKDITGTASNSPLIIVNANCEIDEINVEVPTGITRQRGVSLTGDNVRIGRVYVTSVDQQSGDNLDGGVRLSALTNSSIGSIEVENYDYGIRLSDSCENLSVGRVRVESYLCGVNVRDGVNISMGHSGGMHITGRTPNWVAVAAGQNGILCGNDSGVDYGTSDITFTDAYIDGAGEHGIRCAGSNHTRRIRIIRPVVKNCGGTCIKFLTGADGVYHYWPSVENPVLSNALQEGIKLSCGMVLYRIVRGIVTNPRIFADGVATCGQHGISLYDISGLSIVNPIIESALENGISIRPTHGTGDEDSPTPVARDINQLTVKGGRIQLCGDDGIYIPTQGLQHRRMVVDGTLVYGNGGWGVNITSDSNPTIGEIDDGYFATIGQDNTLGHFTVTTGNTNKLSLKLRGQFNTGVACANSSTWQDVDGGQMYTYLGDDWIGRGRKRLGAAVTNNNAVANTMQDVTGLSFAVTSGRTYRFKFVAQYSAAATTTGSRWSINGPATTFLQYRSEYSLTATSRTINEGLGGAYDAPAASNTDSPSTSARNMAIVEGTIIPSANGTLILRFASEVAGSAITASANSYVEWEEVI